MDHCTPDEEAPDLEDGNAIAGKRERIPTDGGRQETIRLLKNRRTGALREASKKKKQITELTADEENLHLVKSNFADLDSLFNNFQEAHEALNEHLTSDEDKDKEDDYFIAKQSAALEFRNQIIHWIDLAEARLAERAERLERSSTVSKTSRHSNQSRSSTRSAASARERERVKLAEMIAEKSLLKEKQWMEELKLEIDIAKSRARERVYATIEAEESSRLSACLNSALPLMRSTPLQNKDTSNVLSEHSVVIRERPDYEKLEEIIEVPYHEEINEQQDRADNECGNETKEPNATDHRDVMTKERNATDHRDVTTKEPNATDHRDVMNVLPGASV